MKSLGGSYGLRLKDRASAACGNAFDAVDSPQAGWPNSKNILNFKLLAPFEIAQGRCRDFVLTGTNAPARDAWEIRFLGQLIASELNPKGWDVERDHTLYRGFNVCVPQPSHRNHVKNAENMGISTISDPMGWSRGAFCSTNFTIINEIKGLKHISYGMAVFAFLKRPHQVTGMKWAIKTVKA